MMHLRTQNSSDIFQNSRMWLLLRLRSGLTHLSNTPVWRRGRSWPRQEGPLPRWDTAPAPRSPSSSEGRRPETEGYFHSARQQLCGVNVRFKSASNLYSCQKLERECLYSVPLGELKHISQLSADRWSSEAVKVKCLACRETQQLLLREEICSPPTGTSPHLIQAFHQTKHTQPCQQSRLGLQPAFCHHQKANLRYRLRNWFNYDWNSLSYCSHEA